jgi:hypothetical protein
MQDEHFMKLWVEAHAFSPASGTVTDVLGNRFDMLRESVGTIGKACGQTLASQKPLPGARAQMARLFAWAVPVGVFAGITAAAIAGASASLDSARVAAGHMHVASYVVPYLA